MARELPIADVGNVITYTLGHITYTLGHMTYTSVVTAVVDFDNHGYLTVELYDLLTPDHNTFSRATIEDPALLSLNPRVANLHIYDYDEYTYEHPELFI